MSTPPSKRLRKAAAKHGQSEPEPEPEPASVPPAADSDPAGRLLGRLRDRESSSGRAAAEAKTFAVGARVRVASGAFAGKSGVVQALDGRGARVMLGLLSARIDLKDLVGETEPTGGGRDRLTLSSSHRKPH